MRNNSHLSQTLIASIREAIDKWRHRHGWSRETVVSQIVEAHERINGPSVTDICFEPKSTDPYKRMKADADRVCRWLDDFTKDRNLLPANFIPSILAALPADLRTQLLNDLLRPANLAVRLLDGQAEVALDVGLLQSMIKESGESQTAVAGLLNGSTLDALIDAEREISESIETNSTALKMVQQALRDGGDGHGK